MCPQAPVLPLTHTILRALNPLRVIWRADAQLVRCWRGLLLCELERWPLAFCAAVLSAKWNSSLLVYGYFRFPPVRLSMSLLYHFHRVLQTWRPHGSFDVSACWVWLVSVLESLHNVSYNHVTYSLFSVVFYELGPLTSPTLREHSYIE